MTDPDNMPPGQDPSDDQDVRRRLDEAADAAQRRHDDADERERRREAADEAERSPRRQ